MNFYYINRGSRGKLINIPGSTRWADVKGSQSEVFLISSFVSLFIQLLDVPGHYFLTLCPHILPIIMKSTLLFPFITYHSRKVRS